MSNKLIRIIREGRNAGDAASLIGAPRRLFLILSRFASGIDALWSRSKGSARRRNDVVHREIGSDSRTVRVFLSRRETTGNDGGGERKKEVLGKGVALWSSRVSVTGELCCYISKAITGTRIIPLARTVSCGGGRIAPYLFISSRTQQPLLSLPLSLSLGLGSCI